MGNEASTPTTTGTAAAPAPFRQLRAIRAMDSTIRQRLKGGVSYNMKVVLRGERGSGKSALLARLQGLPFKPEYAPTPEIQTATISWTGTAEGADAVKVEVWDVVDRGIRPGAATRGQHRKKRSGNSMLAAPADEDEEEGGGVVVEDDDALAGIPLDLPVPPAAPGVGGGTGAGQHVALGLLDARMVDCYKQAQCAVFLVNPFSASALAYLGKELPAVPRDIPVLLLLNFRDILPLEEEQASSASVASPRPVHVTLAALRGVAAAEAVRRGAGARPIHAFACSMQNCFGLRALYQYLNLPFLTMKEALLARQLAATKEELAATGAAVAAAIEGESWPAFLQSLRNEEREPAVGASAVRAPASLPAAAPAAPVQQQPVPAAAMPRMGTAGQGVEESKRSSSSAASRRSAPPPPEPRPRSATPSAESGAGGAALADVDDFAYRPTAARSELDAFLADAEADEEEGAAAAAMAARREEERRRASIAACLKPEADVVDDGSEEEEEKEQEVGGVGRSSSSSQRYAGLAPVHLDTSGRGTGSVGASVLAVAPVVVEIAAQGEEEQQQPQQQPATAAASATEEAPAVPEAEKEDEEDEEEATEPPAAEEGAAATAAPPAAPAPTIAMDEDEDEDEDTDDEPTDLGPGILEVANGDSGGEDDDEPAGLPIAGQGVPVGFFDDEEEDEDGGFGVGIGGIGGVPARPLAYPRPSAFQSASSAPAAPAKSSDAAPAGPKSGSTGALSDAARAAIAMTMASLEQELGGSGSGSGSVAVTAGGVQEACELSASSSKKKKKHHSKEEKHERKKSSSSHRKHKKKSSSEREQVS